MQARRGDDGARDLDLLVAKLRVDIAAFTTSRADIAQGISALRPGPTSGQSQFWRLFCLRSGEGQVSPIAVQRQRFRADRCDRGIVLKGFEYLSSSRASRLASR